MVNYWGRKYGCDKEEYWRSADIFVFPTLNEAFGLVLLEAMEHGFLVWVLTKVELMISLIMEKRVS